MNIEALQARIRNGLADDTFLVIGKVEAEGLKVHLDRPPTAAAPLETAVPTEAQRDVMA